MFAKLKSWLGNGSPPAAGEAQSIAVAASEPAAVPPQARELAHRLLKVVLNRLGAGERAADLEEMDIAPHRVLVQLLPLRVYVYALGSWMADHDFEAMLSSQRAPGAVFDAFEIHIGKTHCGFYVYSLSALSDQETLAEMWSLLRDEIGQKVQTAKLPPEHTRHHGYVPVTIDGDPDALALQLIAPDLPSKFLDQVSIADEKGCADFIAQLFLRMGKASIEKDELIGFVEKNRSHFDTKFMRLLEVATQAAVKTDKATGVYFDYVHENIKFALARDFAKMDMRSDRLFWLVYALAQLVQARKIDYPAARGSLARPDVVQRISRHQLLYMIQDIAEALDSPQEPSSHMMLLIGECALMGKTAAPLEVACGILAQSAHGKNLPAITDLLTRAVAWLRSEGRDTAELARQLGQLQDRTRPIPDEDF